jgi:hypothetical protein
MTQTTLLTPYSVGIVAVNMPLDTHTVEVTPIEALPFIDGEITDNMETTNLKGANAAGGAYESIAKSSVTVTATWMPFGSNRRTAPNVRRGEKVMLWRYGDTDKFYWSSLDYAHKLRKLETVIFQISDTQNEDAEATDSNTYFMEWSTHTGKITLHTSKSNGEPFTYDFQINAKDGNWTFTDDIKNYICCDSKNRRIEIHNADGTWIDMDKKNMIVTVPNDLTFKVGHNVKWEIGNDETSTIGNNQSTKVGSNRTEDIGSNASLKVGSAWAQEASTITTKANTTTNTVPMTSFTGNVSVANMLATKSFGGGAGGGSFTVSCPGTFQQAVGISSTATITKIVTPSKITGPGFD